MSAGVWTDPDFDPGLSAFYYAKVIEIPTPRWTAYEAQRFGIDRPDEVPMPTQQLERPLDFLVVADHAENLGLAPLIAESDPSVLANPRGKMVHDLVKSGKGTDAFNEWIARMQALDDPFAADTGMAATAWTRATATAEEFNKPGVFTAIIASMLSTTKASTLMSASRCRVSVIGFVGSEDHAPVGTDCLADQIVLI